MKLKLINTSNFRMHDLVGTVYNTQNLLNGTRPLLWALNPDETVAEEKCLRLSPIEKAKAYGEVIRVKTRSSFYLFQLIS